MRRISPGQLFKNRPCSVTAVGCALGISTLEAVEGLYSHDLHADGYLSLDGMNRLVRANLSVVRRSDYKRGERPCLRDFCPAFKGKAIVCVSGHYVYVCNGNYHSFFRNGDDEVITVWEVSDGV